MRRTRGVSQVVLLRKLHILELLLLYSIFKHCSNRDELLSHELDFGTHLLLLEEGFLERGSKTEVLGDEPLLLGGRLLHAVKSSEASLAVLNVLLQRLLVFLLRVI